MKRTNIILLSLIICSGGIAFFLVCIYAYDVKKSKIKESAREAFVKAFNQELKSRDLEEYFSFNYNAKTIWTSDVPDSVYVDDKLGRRWYKLDPVKHHLNITDNPNLRSIHSYIFDKKPIRLDSLHCIWEHYLKDSNIFIESALCMSIMDKNGIMKPSKKDHSKWFTSSNVMFSIYIGYTCEIEIIGYLHYSLWNMMWIDIVCYLLIYFAFVYIVYKMTLILMARIKSMRQKEIVEVPVIKVVQEVTNTPTRTYMLHNRFIFYAELRIIEDSENNTRTKLRPQTSILLELFLKAESDDYILDDEFIKARLWRNGSGNLDRLHKATGRVRLCVQEMNPANDVVRSGDTYQLIIK